MLWTREWCLLVGLFCCNAAFSLAFGSNGLQSWVDELDDERHCNGVLRKKRIHRELETRHILGLKTINSNRQLVRVCTPSSRKNHVLYLPNPVATPLCASRSIHVDCL